MKLPRCIARCKHCGHRFDVDSGVMIFLVLGLLLGLMLASLLCPSAHGQERTALTIPFHSAENLILLDAELNGRPATFLLDTGSNVSFVDYHAARSIRFKADKVRRVGQTGCLRAYEHLSLAGRNFHAQGLCVADLSDMQKGIGSHIDGLLGQDFLRQFSGVRIDYKAQSVTLSLLLDGCANPG